jgi:hypothetical protein
VICRRVRVGYTRGGRRVGRTRARRVRRAPIDVFFSKPYPIRLIPVPVAGTQVLCTGTGVLGHEYEIFFCCFFPASSLVGGYDGYSGFGGYGYEY